MPTRAQSLVGAWQRPGSDIQQVHFSGMLSRTALISYAVLCISFRCFLPSRTDIMIANPVRKMPIGGKTNRQMMPWRGTAPSRRAFWCTGRRHSEPRSGGTRDQEESQSTGRRCSCLRSSPHLGRSGRMQARVSNRGKHKTYITCLFYIGCEIRAQLLPDSRDSKYILTLCCPILDASQAFQTWSWLSIESAVGLSCCRSLTSMKTVLPVADAHRKAMEPAPFVPCATS
jgi:hypothetical protein